MPRDIDQITERLRSEIPGALVTQLQVTHSGADDGGVWFVKVPSRRAEVQLESPSGGCPFLIESDFSPQRHHGSTVDEVVETGRRLFAEPSASRV